MDPLTQIVGLLRPKALTWKVAEGGGDWASRFPAHSGVAFCLIAAGSCRLQLEGGATIPLDEGDFVLLSAPPRWTLSDGAPSDAVDFQRVGAERLRRRMGQPDAAPATRLVGGHFSFDDANGGLLTDLMPGVVRIGAEEATAGRLRGVLALIDDEAFSDRPGRGLVLERLLEIMLVEAIRHAAGPAGDVRPGLLAGLADGPVAAALRAMHRDVARAWTVATLAAEAGTSRSVLAERFTRIVGVTPIDYLLRWRMALAKDALRFGNRRLVEVAEACGYRSASAFSTAFRRMVGCPPARYAKARDPVEAPVEATPSGA